MLLAIAITSPLLYDATASSQDHDSIIRIETSVLHGTRKTNEVRNTRMRWKDWFMEEDDKNVWDNEKEKWDQEDDEDTDDELDWDQEDDDTEDKCADTVGKFIIGRKMRNCSQVRNSHHRLCRKKVFKKSCPVSCNTCENVDNRDEEDDYELELDNENDKWDHKDEEDEDDELELDNKKEEWDQEDDESEDNCADTVGKFIQGRKMTTCSQARNSNHRLCRKKVFQKACPVSCDKCENVENRDEEDDNELELDNETEEWDQEDDEDENNELELHNEKDEWDQEDHEDENNELELDRIRPRLFQ